MRVRLHPPPPSPSCASPPTAPPACPSTRGNGCCAPREGGPRRWSPTSIPAGPSPPPPRGTCSCHLSRLPRQRLSAPAPGGAGRVHCIPHPIPPTNEPMRRRHRTGEASCRIFRIFHRPEIRNNQDRVRPLSLVVFFLGFFFGFRFRSPFLNPRYSRGDDVCARQYNCPPCPHSPPLTIATSFSPLLCLLL